MTDPSPGDRCTCGHLRASHRPVGPHYPAVCIAHVKPASDALGFCLCEQFTPADAPAPATAPPAPPAPRTSPLRAAVRRALHTITRHR